MAYNTFRSRNPAKTKFRGKTKAFFKDMESIISLPCESPVEERWLRSKGVHVKVFEKDQRSDDQIRDDLNTACSHIKFNLSFLADRG